MLFVGESIFNIKCDKKFVINIIDQNPSFKDPADQMKIDIPHTESPNKAPNLLETRERHAFIEVYIYIYIYIYIYAVSRFLGPGKPFLQNPGRVGLA